MSKIKEKVVFYFPWREISGGPYYLTRLANELAKDESYQVYYIDYEKSTVDDMLDFSLIHKIIYTDNDFTFPISEPITLIVPVYLPHKLPELHPDSKIVFFNWHNCCMPALKSNWQLTPDMFDKFMRLMRDTNSVFFLDCAHRLAQNTRDLKFLPQYVPIILPKKMSEAQKSLINEDEINIGILGRICADKMPSILNLLDNINDLNETLKINIHVIGDGSYMEIFKEKIKKYKNCNIILYGVLIKNKLDSCLCKKIDVLFAMGTSILEGAALKLPSVIMSHNVKNFTGNNFVYLQNSVEYCLGWFDTQIDELKIKPKTIQEIIIDIYRHNKKQELGQAAYEYYCQNHLNNINQFKCAIKKSELKFSKVQKLLSSHYLLDSQCSFYDLKLLSIYKNYRNDIKVTLFKKIPLINFYNKTYQEKQISFLRLPVFRVTKNVSNVCKIRLLLIDTIKLSIEDRINKFKLKKDTKREIKSQLKSNLKKGQKIKVCLFVSKINCWLFNDLYKMMKNSTIFHPVVVVVPFPFQGHDAMVRFMDECYLILKRRGINVVKTYDDETKTYLDIRADINPDIIFYTKNRIEHFYEPYYITHFLDKLNYFISYAFDAVNQPELFDMQLNNLVDKYFVPTKIHKKIAKKYAENKGENVIISGYPKTDIFFDKTYRPNNAWKPQDKNKKRIIWAPNHSVDMPENLYQLYAFEELNEFMFEIAEKYKDTVQFAFKPHPMLRAELEYSWGFEKTNEYYNRWITLKNGQLNDAEYSDLFLTSDAMILDSCSFIAEYTATNKPIFFTIGENSRVKWNKLGKENFKVIYKNSSNLKDEIVDFIDNVVINGQDPLLRKREKFVKKYLKPKHNRTASEKIYNVLLKECYI